MSRALASRARQTLLRSADFSPSATSSTCFEAVWFSPCPTSQDSAHALFMHAAYSSRIFSIVASSAKRKSIATSQTVYGKRKALGDERALRFAKGEMFCAPVGSTCLAHDDGNVRRKSQRVKAIVLKRSAHRLIGF